MPGETELSERLPAVLAVVYLIFNEGYAAHTGDALVREILREEAIRLGRILVELMPIEPEVLGLLALMELQASRAAARTDPDGGLVLLADQDRSRWDRTRIMRGLACLDRAGVRDRPGPYQLQAAIAACHARAVSWDVTDWSEIVSHYGALAEIVPSPVVELNRAVAIGLAHGPAAGLTALEAIKSPALRAYHLLPAETCRLSPPRSSVSGAADAYRQALTSPTTRASARFRGQGGDLEVGSGPPTFGQQRVVPAPVSARPRGLRHPLDDHGLVHGGASRSPAPRGRRSSRARCARSRPAGGHNRLSGTCARPGPRRRT